MTNDKDWVLEERFDNVLVLTMNRPERHHALNQALAQGLAAALTRAEEDPEVRVVVLTGSGTKAFCAGADMIEISGIDDGESDTTPSKITLAIDKVAHTPLPVIAAINGYCYGGGALLAIACDIRLACESATFRLPGAEYGLVVGAATFPRLVGSSRAKELIFTARKFDARQAHDWGMVNSLHSPTALMPAAMELANEIAANSVAAVRESKRVIDTATLSRDAVEMEVNVNRELRGSPEHAERFRSATRKVTGR